MLESSLCWAQSSGQTGKPSRINARPRMGPPPPRCIQPMSKQQLLRLLLLARDAAEACPAALCGMPVRACP